jgi:hypothetical protein
MEDKRIKLFGDIVAFAAIKKEVANFERKYPNGYPDWKAINFKDEATVKALHVNVTNMGIFNPPFSEKDFFQKFACDILKTSTNCVAATNQNTNIFACLSVDSDLKPDGGGTTLTYNGDRQGKAYKWTFFTNNRFVENPGRRMGRWDCVGTDNYKIRLDGENEDFYVFKENNTSNTNTNTNTNTSTNTGLVDTNLTSNDLTAGKVVKVGMKGNIVGDIQQLLIDKGFIHVSKNDKADNIFGNRTKRMVKAFQAANGLTDDGVVGKNTWAKLNGEAIGNNNSTNQATSLSKPEEVPGSDAIIVQESRKKILRKYLLQFK